MTSKQECRLITIINVTYLARSHFNLWLGTRLPLSTVKATGCQPALSALSRGEALFKLRKPSLLVCQHDTKDDFFMYLPKVQTLRFSLFFNFILNCQCINMYTIRESVHTVCMSSTLLRLSGMTRVPVFFHSSCAEQLVLYMKAEECLSSALRIAKESISQGELTPSAPVKQGEN